MPTISVTRFSMEKEERKYSMTGNNNFALSEEKDKIKCLLLLLLQFCEMKTNYGKYER